MLASLEHFFYGVVKVRCALVIVGIHIVGMVVALYCFINVTVYVAPLAKAGLGVTVS